MNCIKCKREIPDESAFCNWCGFKQNAEVPARSPRKRGSGGTVYKRGKTYTARVTSHEGGRHSVSKSGFIKKTDAIAYLPTLEQELLPKQISRIISFSALYESWSEKKYNGLLSKRQISQSTITAYKIAYKRCEPLYAYDDFRNIHYAEMQEIIDGLSSYDTQKDVKEMLNQMSEYAMKNEWCERNYAALLDLTNYKKPEKDSFTEEEVQALWHDYLGMDEHGNTDPKNAHPFTGFILIMIHCGLRYGELSTIEKSNINFDERYMMGGIKTELSKASPIAISDEILPVIKEKYEAGKNKLLHMNEDNFYEAYYEACERAGVRKLNPHCCRHTYITRLTRANTAPATIQKGARHSSYKTTLGYTHMNISDVLQAVNSLPRVIEDKPDQESITHV